MSGRLVAALPTDRLLGIGNAAGRGEQGESECSGGDAVEQPQAREDSRPLLTNPCLSARAAEFDLLRVRSPAAQNTMDDVEERHEFERLIEHRCGT